MDSTCSYSIRLATCENKDALFKAWFNNNISEADLDLLKHPDNKIELCLKKTGKAVRLEPSFSLTPKFNVPVDFPESGEIKLGDPWNCTSKLTIDDKAMKEVVTFDDGTVYTFDTVFNSQGASQKVSSNKDGHITSAFWEAAEVGIDGFYMLESHVDMDKMMVEMGVKASDAAAMLDGLAMQILEENGTYNFTDYFGTGGTKTESFKLNEEYVSSTPEFGLEMDCLVAKTGPNTFKATQKDKKSGKVQIWTVEATQASLIFNVEKPFDTVKASAVYRRYPAFLGSWKVVSIDNGEPGMRAMGLSESQIEAMLKERATHTYSYVGKGKFQHTTGAQSCKDPFVWKCGEEYSINKAGFSFSQVITLNRTGLTSVQKFAGNRTICIKTRVGKTFTVMENGIVGRPETQAVTIMMRV